MERTKSLTKEFKRVTWRVGGGKKLRRTSIISFPPPPQGIIIFAGRTRGESALLVEAASKASKAPHFTRVKHFLIKPVLTRRKTLRHFKDPPSPPRVDSLHCPRGDKHAFATKILLAMISRKQAILIPRILTLSLRTISPKMYSRKIVR